MAMRVLFDNADFALMILETGYKKPLASLVLSDKPAIISVLKSHMLMKVKAELDQFCEGLGTCGILSFIRLHPSVMSSCFIHTPVDLTAGVSPEIVLALLYGGKCILYTFCVFFLHRVLQISLLCPVQ